MATIRCSGKDGTIRDFIVTSEEETSYDESDDGEREVTFWVKSSPDAPESFELSLREKAMGEFQVVWVGPQNGREHRGMGIPETLLPYAKQTLAAKKIRSSRSNIEGTTDRRTQDATKMWERLKSKGMARYDRADDRYSLV